MKGGRIRLDGAHGESGFDVGQLSGIGNRDDLIDGCADADRQKVLFDHLADVNVVTNPKGAGIEAGQIREGQGGRQGDHQKR
jgi:hypothetical protein